MALQLDEWEALLLSMCTMLVHMPATAMKSVCVTGSLRGVAWDARSLASLCKRLAGEHGLRYTVQVDGSSFTVRFSRLEDRRPALRRKLGPSI
jgi:hypothetical protein